MARSCQVTSHYPPTSAPHTSLPNLRVSCNIAEGHVFSPISREQCVIFYELHCCDYISILLINVKYTTAFGVGSLVGCSSKIAFLLHKYSAALNAKLGKIKVVKKNSVSIVLM